jgi:hypothetical protein
MLFSHRQRYWWCFACLGANAVAFVVQLPVNAASAAQKPTAAVNLDAVASADPFADHDLEDPAEPVWYAINASSAASGAAAAPPPVIQSRHTHRAAVAGAAIIMNARTRTIGPPLG